VALQEAVLGSSQGASCPTRTPNCPALPLPQVALAFLSDAGAVPSLRPFNKRAALVAMSVLDAAGAAVFLAASLALIVISKRLCNEVGEGAARACSRASRSEGRHGAGAHCIS
jgi:hypothetical protein